MSRTRCPSPSRTRSGLADHGEIGELVAQRGARPLGQRPPAPLERVEVLLAEDDGAVALVAADLQIEAHRLPAAAEDAPGAQRVADLDLRGGDLLLREVER